MLEGQNILVLGTECQYAATDCRHCGMAEKEHGFHNICERADLRMIGARFTPFGVENLAALGLSIGCAYSYQTERCRWFDSHTLEHFMSQCVQAQPLLVSFNGLAHDFPLMRELLRTQAALVRLSDGPGAGARTLDHAADHAGALMVLCEVFQALCATSYDLLAEILKTDPQNKGVHGLNSLDAICQASGLAVQLSDGAQAQRDWRAGRYAAVNNHCRDNVYKTKALFEMVCEGKPLLRGDGKSIILPKPTLSVF